MGYGIGADHLGGALNVHPPQPRGTCEQRIGADAEAGGNRPAQVLAFGRDHIERSGGAEVHHDTWAAIALKGGDRIDQPVGAQFGWIVDQHRHARLDTRLNKQGSNENTFRRLGAMCSPLAARRKR